MSGAFSIPFALLAFFYPQRLAFAALAYLSLWVLVIGQLKRIGRTSETFGVAKRNAACRARLDRYCERLRRARDRSLGSWQDWNTGDRGVERCRLKLLNVESQNVPKEMTMLAPASSS